MSQKKIEEMTLAEILQKFIQHNSIENDSPIVYIANDYMAMRSIISGKGATGEYKTTNIEMPKFKFNEIEVSIPELGVSQNTISTSLNSKILYPTLINDFDLDLNQIDAIYKKIHTQCNDKYGEENEKYREYKRNYENKYKNSEYYSSFVELLKAVQVHNYKKIGNFIGVEVSKDSELAGKDYAANLIGFELKELIQKAYDTDIGTNQFKQILSKSMESFREKNGITEKEFTR